MRTYPYQRAFLGKIASATTVTVKARKIQRPTIMIGVANRDLANAITRKRT